MNYLKQAFRWYGPADPVKLHEILQAGATDIVTALHHIPNGSVWSREEILKRKKEINQAGLEWSVVESLPVTEAIKTRKGNYQQDLENYLTSLCHLGEAGIKIVTYNFMPILDWTRTDLEYKLPAGYTTLRFDHLEMVVFDLYILQREGAIGEYDDAEREQAQTLYRQMKDEDKNRIQENILKGLPGSEEGYTIDDFREKLSTYQDVDHGTLRSNLYLFLQEILPVVEKYDIKMVIHPDDPPFDIFGLPRIMSNLQDMDDLVSAFPSAGIGFCFCTGSFGVRPDNDLVQMARRHASRVHFLHFRSTLRDQQRNFYEANHLDGDANIPEVIKVFIEENQKRPEGIPFRPDHGYRMLDDLQKKSNPGYSLLGRMKGLAEIRGLERGLIASGIFKK